MKVLLGAGVNPEEWFKQSHDHDDIIGHLDNLGRQALVGVQPDSWFDLMNKSDLGLRERIIREAVIKRSCLARVQNYRQCEVEMQPGQYLHSVLQTPLFQKMFSDHSADLEKSENRELFFQRKVGHLLPFAQKFEFLDAFFSKNIIGRSSGATFVLEKCLDAEIPIIEIHTFETDEHPDLTDAHLEKIHGHVKALFGRKKRASSVNIKIYGGSKSDFPHDRFGEISFLHSSLGFAIGQGSEVFNGFSQRPAPVFEPIKRSFQDLRIFLDSKELIDEIVLPL